MCCRQSVVEREDSVLPSVEPVLLAIVVFSKPHKREELWGCPNCLYLVDKKLGLKIGIHFRDYLWALKFSKEEHALTQLVSI